MNKEYIFKNELDVLIILKPDAIKKLLKYRQLNITDTEAAGVLIGEKRGQHFVICDISEPQKKDVRSRYSVNRCDPEHQQIVNKAFNLSNGTWQYLGEWHTHPEANPYPSITDTNSWNQNLTKYFPIILIIIGTKTIWVAQKDSHNIYKFEQIYE